MIEFLKAKGFDVKGPVWDFNENAGVDFYAPSFNDEFKSEFYKIPANKCLALDKESVNNTGFIRIPPHSGAVIPSGYYVKFPSNIAFTNIEKSGVCIKQFLTSGARLIDTSYQGIILISIINWSDDYTTIYENKQLAQFVPYLIDISGCKVQSEDDISKDDFFSFKSKRGDGCMGSTGVD